MTPKVKGLLLTAAVNLCRGILAATFIFSGWVKANDPLGTVYKLEEYLAAMAGMTLPHDFLLASAVVLATAEFVLGVCAALGSRRKTVAGIMVVVMVFMTLLTVYIVVKNPVSDCGCFGDAIILSNGATLAKNIVLLAAALVAARFYRLQRQLPSSKLRWALSHLSVYVCLAYAVRCIVALPVVDFRPYKVGTDMRKAVTQRRFEVTFIYQRGDETLELPTGADDPDSTWTFVETRTTPVGDTDLATADFCVTDADGMEVTEDILMEDGDTYLLVIPDLTAADEGCVDKVNEVYDHAMAHGAGFYCLTASQTADARHYWTEHTGAEYGYHTADDKLLKTVVRGNPGLVLLRDGVVIKKWSNFNLPGTEELDAMERACQDENEEEQ